MSAQPIDVPLRQHRAEPRRQTAASMEVAEQRSPLARAIFNAEEIGIERIRQVASFATRIDRVRGSIEKRPVRQDEVIPRRIIPVRARARERQIVKMKRGQVALELSRIGSASGKCALGARLKCLGKTILRHAPSLAFRVAITAVDEAFVNLQTVPLVRTDAFRHDGRTKSRGLAKFGRRSHDGAVADHFFITGQEKVNFQRGIRRYHAQAAEEDACAADVLGCTVRPGRFPKRTVP
jgi:hypothetical protein